MTEIYVQFSDANETLIISVFDIPQDPEVWPNQGTVEATDPRWKAFYETLPPGIQQGWPAPTP